jgi:GTP-binding protein
VGARTGAAAPDRTERALPLVAIVGRPNVGKSTLFNRIVGSRTAIVEDRARTTRDRLYGDGEWNGRRFVLIDTGGLEVDTDDPIELRVQEQARLAIAQADVIVFVVDAAAGMTPADLEAAEAARWDAAIAAEADAAPAAIAFVGRPNVGKSSLLNALLGEERAIVSDIPGTTRDAIDTRLAWGRSEVVLIDTAGIRRRGKVASGQAAERYSTMRALTALARADVAVLVIDAVEGLTSQDAHVAGYAVEEGKGLVLAVNKWDLVEDKTDRTFDQYIEWIRSDAPFLEFAPVVSISAKTGQRVGRVLELAIDIWAERRKRVSTGELNRLLMAATDRTPPPLVRGKRPKLFYATQAAIAPPTFVFFASDASSVHFSYRRYLENRLRDAFGFHGTPIRLVFRDRASVKLPRRRKPRPVPTKATRRSAPRSRRPR